MEPRIEIEREHFNKQARECLKSPDRLSSSENLNSAILIPYVFCEEILRHNCRNKRVLDYGCGMGRYSIFMAKNGGEVTGIDISDVSIEVAKEKATREGVDKQTRFLVMNCEALEFDDDSFDIVFNSGTLAYLDLQKALTEIVRVLKPGGIFLGIDTLGHNPLLNLNRKMKQRRNLRSQWSVDHILRKSDLKMLKRYFGKAEFRFFNLATLAAVPFPRLPGFGLLLGLLKAVDGVLLRLPYLKNWAFKVVFILSQPNKSLSGPQEVLSSC
jgi:ubiquinone/menaquinone biosynthesis C-methylase UbiE